MENISRLCEVNTVSGTSADSIVPAGVQGYDRYAYVNNSPVNFVDPTGHLMFDFEDEGIGGQAGGSGEGDGGSSTSDGGGGGGGEVYEPPTNEQPNLNTFASPESEALTVPTIAGIPTDSITIENASKLGVPGENSGNRVIVTGVSGAENVNIAQEVVDQMINNSNSKLVSKEPTQTGNGTIYTLENGTRITFRREASGSENMPKINVNCAGSYSGLIFYPK